jgi:hypothetical protein
MTTIVAVAVARTRAAVNDDDSFPIIEVIRNSPGMNPPRSLTMTGTASTTAELQQQQRSNTLRPVSAAQLGSSTIEQQQQQ